MFRRAASPAPGRSTDSQGKGRKGILRLGLRRVDVRLSKVLRSDDRLFTGWINDLNQKKNISAFSDHHLAPISLAETIEALVAISQSPDSGMFQMSGARDISYFDAARRLASLTNADPNLIAAVKLPKVAFRRTKSSVTRRSMLRVSPPSPVGRHAILCLSSTKSFATEPGEQLQRTAYSPEILQAGSFSCAE